MKKILKAMICVLILCTYKALWNVDNSYKQGIKQKQGKKPRMLYVYDLLIISCYLVYFRMTNSFMVEKVFGIFINDASILALENQRK